MKDKLERIELPAFCRAGSGRYRARSRRLASGAAEVTISPDRFIAARFGNLSPQLTRLAMGVMHSLLPSDECDNAGTHRGADVRSRELYPAATVRASAAERYNQTGAATDVDEAVAETMNLSVRVEEAVEIAGIRSLGEKVV